MQTQSTGNEPQGRPVEVPQKAGGSASQHPKGDCGADAEVPTAEDGNVRTPPSDIEVMLYFYYSPERHPRAQALAVQHAIFKFVRDGLLVSSGQKDGRFSATDRGRAWVEMICATPYPEQVWRNPLTKEVFNT